MTTQDKDDDFAGMLKRVRAASGSEAPSPPGSREPPPEKKTEGGSFVSWFGLFAIAGVLVAGVIGLASLSTWIARRMVAQGASADNPALRRRQLQQQRLLSYTVPVDTTISPLEAGRQLHAIGNAGFSGPLRKWEQEPASTFAASCCPTWTRDAVRLFGSNRNWAIPLFAAARRGLNAEQRALLRNVARDPILEPFRRVAHARAADLSALWSVPSDTQVSWAELPTFRPAGLRQAAAANDAAAALDLADGRTASAELRLREVISIGFLIQRNARSTVEEAFAGWMVNSGRAGLEAFYLAVGRTDAAAQISAKSDPQIPVSNANRRVRADEIEATLLRRIADTTELAGMRWQLLLGPFSYLPCTSVRGALFGPGARYRAALAEFRAAMVKYPSDERRLTMVVRGVPQMIDPMVGFRQRSGERPAWADFAKSITRSEQLATCASLFRR